MKVLYGFILFFNLVANSIFGQGKIIDVAACHEWVSLEEISGKSCIMSFDGNSIMFKTSSKNMGAETVLKDLKLATERRFIGAYDEGSFDSDKMFSFQLLGDSLVVFDTQTGSYTYLTGVKAYFIIKSIKTDMLAYFTEEAGKRALTIWNVGKNRKMRLSDVDKYWLNKQGTALLTKGGNGLTYTDLVSLKQTLVTSNKNVENAAVSLSGGEIAYISHDAQGYELRYFNIHYGANHVLVNDSSEDLKDDWKLEPIGLSFDNDDGNIFFKLSRTNSYYERQGDSVITTDVNVWSHHDLHLQTRQLSLLPQKSSFTSMINISSRKIIHLESDELALEILGNTDKFLVLSTRINENEFYWNKEKMKIFLFSVSTGKKIQIKESKYPGHQFIGVSPNNKFLVWFDGEDKNYYSYNIENDSIINISKFDDGSLSMLNQRGESAKAVSKVYPYANQYWIDNGNSLIVNAQNDIWQLDPFGVKEPINLTSGYGKSKNIRFRLVDKDNSLLKLNNTEFLVWAFDNQSKQNGFWKISTGKSSPVKLLMSDNAYFFDPQAPIFSTNSAEDARRFVPIKASQEKLFILRVMSSAAAPNLYYTSDFKNFKQLTDITPSKGYVWISTKLITWKLPDGQQAEGILHRPDNFDSTKKYPIIFNYYERRSECLNVFRTPQLSGHNINIPWYVSRGYLVFEPDFYYKKGKTAESVINSVESALVELKKLPYIDQNKMGIQGQSHGGYETNILATGTHLFAAACEMAGYSNIISEYGSMRPNGFNNQMAADVGQRNLGVFPWEHPEVFIENSPVFHVSEMNTPLLMVHNKEDGAVLFPQAIELYLSMRRLGKEVWLLQYDNEGHTIIREGNKLDFTIRMQQFFDHYLKGAPVPIWMSKGIPTSLKGVVSGLRYEKSLIGKNR